MKKMATCRRCGFTGILENYPIRAANKTGHDTLCYKCKRELSRKWYKARQEKRKGLSNA
jgi:hypothetical protein